MNKYKKLISNSIIFAIGNLTVKIAQFFLLPILTLYFTTEQYGLSTTLLDIVELLTPIVTLGIAEGLFRFTVDGSHNNEELMSSGLAVIMCGFAVFTVGYLIFYAINPQNYILLLIPLFFVRGLKKFVAEFARGLGRTFLYAFNGIFESVSLIGSSALFLLVFDMGVEGYVLSLIVSALVSLIFYVVACKPYKYIKFSAINKKKLNSSSLTLAVYCAKIFTAIKNCMYAAQGKTVQVRHNLHYRDCLRAKVGRPVGVQPLTGFRS
jgi:O-antigen/teichoic acid export membrane protein